MSTKNSRKVLSVLLAYMMVLSSFSGMAVAAEENTGENGAQAVVSSGPAPDADAADTVLTSTPDAKDVEDMIEDLPDENDLAELDEEYWEAAEEAVNEAADAYNALDEDEQEKVDPELLEKLEALQEYFSNEPMLMAGESATVSSLEELKKAIEQKASTITLDNEITTTDNISVNYIVTIDLNGHTLTVGRFDVAASGDVTLKDSSSDESGVLTSEMSMTIVVFKDGSLTIENGTYSNKYSVKESQPITIFNGGNLTVNGGTIEAVTDGTYGNAIYNGITNSGEANSIINCTINDGLIESNCWGVVVLGKGMDEDGNYNNEEVTLDMSGGEIYAVGQGIATNSSNGAYAGFTITLSGKAKVSGDECGMYLPGPGFTKISGDVEVYGKLQGIRIAAGELNIEGGLIHNSNEREEDTDLISGGSGGTAGAIVAGKASTAYAGNLIVNVTGGTIENEIGDDAIVVSDKNMAAEAYEGTRIEVNVSGGDVIGDIYTVSNLGNTSTDDGGDVSVKLNDITIDGDIENRSKSNVIADHVEILGTVRADEEKDAGTVTIKNNSTINKAVDDNNPNITITDSTVNDEESSGVADGAIVNLTTGDTYTSLSEAITVANENETIKLGAGTYKLTGELHINTDNLTIMGSDPDTTTLQFDGTSETIESLVRVNSDNVTIKDLAITTIKDDGTTVKGNALKFSGYYGEDDREPSNGGTVENVILTTGDGSALNIHGANNVTVKKVTATATSGVGISVADAEDLEISGTTSTGNWGSLGIMYKSDDKDADNEYNYSSQIVLGDGNTLESGIYAEDPSGEDTISSTEPLYKIVSDDGVIWTSTLPEETSGIVLIHEGESVVSDSLEEALAAAREGDTIEIHKDVAVTNSNAMRITQNNLTIIGVSADGEEKPTINLGDTNVSTQAGILVEANNVTLENLNIVSTSENGNVSAVKFSKIPASSDAEMDLIENGNIKNVTISSENGHALNIHGVDGMNVDGLTVEKAGKLSISIANSPSVTISNSTTYKGGWGADIGIMYKDTNEYANASTVVLGNGNTFENGNVFYSDRGETTDTANDVDSVTYADNTVLYKVLGEDDNYYYVEENKIVASIDDSTENPVGYNSLDEAIDDAAAGEKIDLHQDVTNATIDKEVTINGNGNAITGEISIDAENAKITKIDLSKADITIDGSANLSDNYWGGKAPENIPGAEINSYYKDAGMNNKVLVGDQLEAAGSLLRSESYTVSSADANTQKEVNDWLNQKIEEILNGFEGSYTVVDSGVVPAVDGTAEDPDGTDGSFTFTVVLSYNDNTLEVKNLKGIITAAEYILEEPTDPDDPDPKPDDNDDDNSSSSGGSSGGGSFIGHPDGWVPGGIIILDGSEQVQPTGSLLLDTKTYTMAPGVVYDILATLEGASENELRVYSSQPGVASVEAIGGGKYRVTGLADGQTYIMFEVWRDGVMLNHASVKVTIADGVTAYGESNREASIF